MVKFFGGGDAPEQTEAPSLLGITSALTDKVQPNRSLCPSMALRTRIKGFGILFCLGMLISLISSGLIKSLMKGDILKFGIFYTLGTCCSLGSSFFLWGPLAQIKTMFDKKRRITSIIFLSCIVGTIVSCILYPKVPVQAILLFVLVQYCAYFWYSLSFIPFGRTIFCKCFKNAVGDE